MESVLKRLQDMLEPFKSAENGQGDESKHEYRHRSVPLDYSRTRIPGTR